MATRKYEIWALHEKIGKQPWRFATWFTPRYDGVGDDDEWGSAAKYTKNLAKSMTDRLHQYRSVRYTPKGR
jgi:hypothetical protein